MEGCLLDVVLRDRRSVTGDGWQGCVLIYRGGVWVGTDEHGSATRSVLMEKVTHAEREVGEHGAC